MLRMLFLIGRSTGRRAQIFPGSTLTAVLDGESMDGSYGLPGFEASRSA